MRQEASASIFIWTTQSTVQADVKWWRRDKMVRIRDEVLWRWRWEDDEIHEEREQEHKAGTDTGTPTRRTSTNDLTKMIQQRWVFIEGWIACSWWSDDDQLEQIRWCHTLTPTTHALTQQHKHETKRNREYVYRDRCSVEWLPLGGSLLFAKSGPQADHSNATCQPRANSKTFWDSYADCWYLCVSASVKFLCSCLLKDFNWLS